MPKSRRRAKVFLKIAGTGCVGIFLACFVVFVVLYERTGHYMPVISKQPLLPAPNAIEDYRAAVYQLRANGGTRMLYDKDYHLIPDAEPAVVQANKAALRCFRQGLTKQCRIPFNPNSEYGYEFRANGSNLFALIRAEGHVYARQGYSLLSARTGLDLIQFGMDIQRGGPMYASLEGLRAEPAGRQMVVQNIEKYDLPSCNRIAARLERLMLTRPSYSDILRQDRDWMLSYLSKVASESAEYGYQPTGYSQQDRLQAELSAMEWHFNRDGVLKDLEAGYDREIKESARPAALRNPVPQGKGVSGNAQNWFTELRRLFDEAELRNRLVLFAIALRSFKLKQGHYPVTLAELKLEPGLTVDPYSGNSIIYKRFGNDYLLYGVGDDGKDDGGIPVNEAESPKIGDLGISRFYYNSQNGAIQSENFYKLIPHMLPPALPKGAPPLKQ